jgi:hypothetical protein
VFVFFTGLFGEGPAERRERLKTLISELSEDEIAQKLKKKEEQERREEESQNEVTWYHEGSEEMRLSRIAIAQYSLRRYGFLKFERSRISIIFLFFDRAKERLSEQKLQETVPDMEKNSKIQETYRHMRVKKNFLTSSCKALIAHFLPQLSWFISHMNFFNEFKIKTLAD